MEKLETPIERALVLGSLVTAERRVRILTVEENIVAEYTLPGGTDGNITVQLDIGAVGSGLGEQGVTSLEGNGPVDKVKLDIESGFVLRISIEAP